MKSIPYFFAFALLGVLGCKIPDSSPIVPPQAVQSEVRQALDQFSQISGQANLQEFLALFDDQADILLVGSDKGEVFKGRAEMERWLSKLYRYSGFSWKMDRVEISSHEGTAWVFVEGKAVVTNRETGALRFTAPYRFSGVLVKRGNKWMWRLFHGSAPAKE